jgi:ABC-type phosphate/phosphonate transport system substrate-binding protein
MHDKEQLTRSLYVTEPMPDQAFTVSARVGPEMQTKIASALLAPDASVPTEKLRKRFQGGDGLVSANDAEYSAYSVFLKDQWGFTDVVSSERLEAKR